MKHSFWEFEDNSFYDVFHEVNLQKNILRDSVQGTVVSGQMCDSRLPHPRGGRSVAMGDRYVLKVLAKSAKLRTNVDGDIEPTETLDLKAPPGAPELLRDGD